MKFRTKKERKTQSSWKQKITLLPNLVTAIIVIWFVKAQFLANIYSLEPKSSLHPEQESLVESPVVSRKLKEHADINLHLIEDEKANSASFKYILISLGESDDLFVQACPLKEAKTCKHPDALTHFVKEHGDLIDSEDSLNVLGGGRISVYRRKINIYGYSKTFKKRLRSRYNSNSNQISCKLIKKALKAAMDPRVVQWSNKGYKEGDDNLIHEFTMC